MQYDHDVAILLGVPAHTALSAQKIHVALHRDTRRALFRDDGVYLRDVVLLSRRAYILMNIKWREINYDYFLILLTTIILFAISLVTIYGMMDYNNSTTDLGKSYFEKGQYYEAKVEFDQLYEIYPENIEVIIYVLQSLEALGQRDEANNFYMSLNGELQRTVSMVFNRQNVEYKTLREMYLEKMNNLVSPYVIALLLALGICVPKRLFSAKGLTIAAILMIVATIGVSVIADSIIALAVVLYISFALQLVVFILVMSGMKLHFEKTGYWMRVGSSLIHLGFIIFVLDFLFLKEGLVIDSYNIFIDLNPLNAIDPSIKTRTHLVIFWISTVMMSVGCLLTFYAPEIKKKRDQLLSS